MSDITTGLNWTDLVNALATSASVLVAAYALERTRRQDQSNRRHAEHMALAQRDFEMTWEAKRKEREEASERRQLTVDIWQTWVSADYRGYRVRAWRALHPLAFDHPPNQRPQLQSALDDLRVNEDVGSIEHFIDEVAQLKESDLIDEELFDKLFKRTFSIWIGLLIKFDRTDADAFSANDIDVSFNALLGPDYRKLCEEAYRKAAPPPGFKRASIT